MKTITEFSGVLLQRAADVQRAFRAAHPQTDVPTAPVAASESEPAVAAASEAEPTLAEEVPAEATEAPADGAVATEPAEETVAAEAAPADESAEAAPADESAEAAPADESAEAAPSEAAPVDLGTGPEADAVGEALAVQGERLSRLMEALDVAGRRAGQVRLVRVLQGENPPQGAQQRGDYYYAVDLMPRPQSQQRESFEGRDGDRRRGPGGRGPGGRGPGGRSGGPGGARGAGGPPGKGGKFSNDRPGRDGDLREARGEMPRAGAGWTLTRAPDDRRRPDDGDPSRRERRPPRGPRFDGRGPRPPMGAGGDRPPRGPRPERGGGRPPFSGPRGAVGERGPGPGEATGGAPVGASGFRRGPGPARPDGGRGPRDANRSWSGRRRGGWDEPPVPESPAPEAAAAAPEPPAVVEPPPPPAVETPAPARGDDTTPTPTDGEP